MERAVFTKVMSDPVPIPEEGIARAVEILRTGRLFRYGEDTAGISEASRFEVEFATLVERNYAIGVNSCGCSLYLALRALGANPGDPILCNAFTLAPVPGSIAHAACRAVMVDITDNLSIDCDDLKTKIGSSDARILLLSHMRGHVSDLESVMEICRSHPVAVIEDCAHTLGARWNDRIVGGFGDIACFSSQSFKHINSGEGGLIVTDNPDIATRLILMSGSYMMYGQHEARPQLEAFERVRDAMPNVSMRMTNVTAALLRPQLRELATWTIAWNRSYGLIEAGLTTVPNLLPIWRDPREAYVGSSIQFTVQTLDPTSTARFVAEARAHGVFLKWFGAARTAGFTSRYDQWDYIAASKACRNADRILARLVDMRIPLALDETDCATIVRVLREAMEAATR
jgi:dTDP-4-amino-4,6-dideoxygalactose transaminase